MRKTNRRLDRLERELVNDPEPWLMWDSGAVLEVDPRPRTARINKEVKQLTAMLTSQRGLIEQLADKAGYDIDVPPQSPYDYVLVPKPADD